MYLLFFKFFIIIIIARVSWSTNRIKTAQNIITQGKDEVVSREKLHIFHILRSQLFQGYCKSS